MDGFSDDQKREIDRTIYSIGKMLDGKSIRIVSSALTIAAAGVAASSLLSDDEIVEGFRLCLKEARGKFSIEGKC